MSAVPVLGMPPVPKGYALDVEEHFTVAPIRGGASKATGIVTAHLRPESGRWAVVTGPADTDVELTITGTRGRVEAILRAVVGGMTS